MGTRHYFLTASASASRRKCQDLLFQVVENERQFHCIKRTVARVFRSLFRVKITRYMVYLFKGLKKFWNFFRFFQNYSIAQIKNGVWPCSQRQRPLLNVNAQPNILFIKIVAKLASYEFLNTYSIIKNIFPIHFSFKLY